MRPFSFTRNLGGLEKAYKAIRKGYAPDITVKLFRERSGLGPDLSLLVTEFILATKIREGDEIILADELITQTLRQPFNRLLARLYFFAINLNMPGDRLRGDHMSPAEMQNTLIRRFLSKKTDFRSHSLTRTASSSRPSVHLGASHPKMHSENGSTITAI